MTLQADLQGLGYTVVGSKTTGELTGAQAGVEVFHITGNGVNLYVPVSDTTTLTALKTVHSAAAAGTTHPLVTVPGATVAGAVTTALGGLSGATPVLASNLSTVLTNLVAAMFPDLPVS